MGLLFGLGFMGRICPVRGVCCCIIVRLIVLGGLGLLFMRILVEVKIGEVSFEVGFLMKIALRKAF